MPTEVVRNGQSRQENARYNAQLMDLSKIAAQTGPPAPGLRRPDHHHGHRRAIIDPGTPAADGLQIDDVIVAVDGEPIDEIGEIGEVLRWAGSGPPRSPSSVRRAAARVDVPISTVAAEQDRRRRYRHPARGGGAHRRSSISCSTSASTQARRRGHLEPLAFTLAIIDAFFTPGELTGGHVDRRTGTMDLLRQRPGPGRRRGAEGRAVSKCWTEAFFGAAVQELEEVRATVGDDLVVIPVGTLQEANRQGVDDAFAVSAFTVPLRMDSYTLWMPWLYFAIAKTALTCRV